MQIFHVSHLPEYCPVMSWIKNHLTLTERRSSKLSKNLNEWLDQPEVSAAHPPLQVEHGVGHAVRGERGVPGDETQSRVVQSPLHSAQLYNCHVHLFSSIKMSFAQHKDCSLCKKVSNFFQLLCHTLTANAR